MSATAAALAWRTGPVGLEREAETRAHGRPLLSYGARTSDVLTVLASQEGERLSVAEIVAVLRDRAFALLVVLLGLPNCLPMPPPIPLVSGLLLLLVAVQIMAGMATPWLPRRILGLSIARSSIDKAVTRAVPLLRRLERWSRPRMAVFDTALGMRGMGLMLLALSLALIVAPPFFGQIPLGLAISLIGLGLVERDGFVVLIGLVFGGLGVGISIGFVYTLFASLMSALAWGSGYVPGLARLVH